MLFARPYWWIAYGGWGRRPRGKLELDRYYPVLTMRKSLAEVPLRLHHLRFSGTSCSPMTSGRIGAVNVKLRLMWTPTSKQTTESELRKRMRLQRRCAAQSPVLSKTAIHKGKSLRNWIALVSRHREGMTFNSPHCKGSWKDWICRRCTVNNAINLPPPPAKIKDRPTSHVDYWDSTIKYFVPLSWFNYTKFDALYKIADSFHLCFKLHIRNVLNFQ